MPWILENWLILGTSLLTMDGALGASCRVRPPRLGSRAMVRISTHAAHPVHERRKRIPLGKGSTAVRMEAPVVVKRNRLEEAWST